ncbi:expressed unknown protein [Ectocarpus siliculosus]|uniref:Uncharacterized protein n=1 Tax=Ectocarpus siliculosus TaxID=2880 RepID=D7FMS0_ECTSI|nr:expressed unknown protein [Ectocarpus siliculosus]|eukprot:CBJ29985.1 expressed unknown protein [Ectocarpus siliculosus]
MQRWRSYDAASRSSTDTLDFPASSWGQRKDFALDGTWTSRLWCPRKAVRVRLELSQSAVVMTARATMHANSTRKLSHTRWLKLHRCWLQRLVMPIRQMQHTQTPQQSPLA